MERAFDSFSVTITFATLSDAEYEALKNLDWENAEAVHDMVVQLVAENGFQVTDFDVQ